MRLRGLVREGPKKRGEAVTETTQTDKREEGPQQEQTKKKTSRARRGKRGKKKTKTRRRSLFVVTNKGKDVLAAKNLIDGLVKKLVPSSVADFVENLIKILMENVRSYGGLLALQKFMDQLLKRLLSLQEKWPSYTQVASAKWEDVYRCISSVRRSSRAQA